MQWRNRALGKCCVPQGSSTGVFSKVSFVCVWTPDVLPTQANHGGPVENIAGGQASVVVVDH